MRANLQSCEERLVANEYDGKKVNKNLRNTTLAVDKTNKTARSSNRLILSEAIMTPGVTQTHTGSQLNN